MNDLVRQLLAMAPGLASGLAGNGEGSAAFMQGWERARQQDEERQRLKQQDSLAIEDRKLALEDRNRNIARQNTADQVAAQTHQQQQALQSLQIPGYLAELGGTAEDPAGAQALIESAMPKLMQAFGQETMAYGMPAVDIATRTITGRQKKQVEAFVDAALRTSFVADNPEADPEMTNLPDHIRRVIGKPTAKLSELQRFAQLPVGKPATRPSDEVSWQRDELLVNGVPTVVFINPKTREIKNQAGEMVSASPIPPKAPSSIDGRSPAAVATFNQIASQYQRSPLTNASDRTIVLRDAAQAIREDPANPSYQMALAYSYIQALDTYQSAVREGELQNLGSLGTMWQQLLVKANQVATSGAFMPPDVAQQIAEASDRLVQTIESGRAKKQAEFAARARASGVGDLWEQFMAGIPSSAPAPASPPPGAPAVDPAASLPRRPVPSHTPTSRPPAVTRPPAGAGPQLRERRRFGDVLGEWDGTKWVEVRP